MSAQLDLLPALAAQPEPHRYQPLDTETGLGPCSGCGALRLDAVHTVSTGSRGVARLFDALDRNTRDRLGETRVALRRAHTDLLTLADRHADDARFTSGLTWGVAAVERAIAAADGATGAVKLHRASP